jgi:hypothetical protein
VVRDVGIQVNYLRNSNLLSLNSSSPSLQSLRCKVKKRVTNKITIPGTNVANFILAISDMCQVDIPMIIVSMQERRQERIDCGLTMLVAVGCQEVESPTE